MKKNIIYFTLIALTTIFSSCKKDEIFATKQGSDGQITIVVDDKALTGTVYAGAVQPSLNVAVVRFSRAATASPNYFGGNVVVTFNLTSELTKVTVNIVNTSTGARDKKFEASGVSGSTVWTNAITTLGFAGANAPAATYNFEVIASSADGAKTVTRSFQIIIIA